MDETFSRCVAFMRAMEASVAERSIKTDHGVVHLSPALPRVWYRNFLSVEPGSEATTAELVSEAEAVLAPAGLAHRKVAVADELGARVAPEFRALEWKVEEQLVMAAHGECTAASGQTVELEAETLVSVWARGMVQFDHDEETVRQLVAAQLERRHAVDVRYFAVRADGRVASYCELFSQGGIGQIESVMTLEEFRGRGFGKAVVARALSESRAAHELTFLVADAEDWPKDLYRNLGFREVGRTWDFLRVPSEPSSAPPSATAST